MSYDLTNYANSFAANLSKFSDAIADLDLRDAAKAPLASPALTGTPTAPTVAGSTDSSTKIATTAFVQAVITALINGAPGALDTLKEISDQLASDESVAAALATTVAGKLAKASNLSDLADVAAARGNLGKVLQNIGYASGQYYFPCSPGTATTSATLGNGTLRLAPWIVVESRTIVRLGGEITTVGESGSKLRLGIYGDDGTGYPGALLLDAGQIAGDSATVQELTISQALTPGIYWIGGAVQSAPTTQPTARTTNNWHPPIPMRTGSSTPGANAAGAAYSQTGVTGALPANFSTTVTGAGSAPRLFVKTS